MQIPKILYKYRKFPNEYTSQMLSQGEIYFATTNELDDENEKASFYFAEGKWDYDKNNILKFLTPEECKDRLINQIRSGQDGP